MDDSKLMCNSLTDSNWSQIVGISFIFGPRSTGNIVGCAFGLQDRDLSFFYRREHQRNQHLIF
jgi:hypothetical protein